MSKATGDLVFGVDQSLNSTAWCITDADGKLIESRLIRLNPNETKKTPYVKRGMLDVVCNENWEGMAKIWQQYYLSKAVSMQLMADYLEACEKYGFIDSDQFVLHIAIEGLGFGAQGDATRGLAGLQFMIFDRIVDDIEDADPCKKVEIDIIAPTSLKKFATGSGASKKTALYDCLPSDVLSEFSYIPKTKGRGDLVDAYWLSRFGYERLVR